jgi:diamine N-acetyltransferase
VQLAELTADNVAEACRIKVKQGQERFVAPVAESLAEAYVHRETAWPRLIFDDGRVVGFVMGNFDPENEISAFRAGIWRLNVQDLEQGRGYGRFALAAVADEARRRGCSRITVLWIPGEGGPEGFYLKLGSVRQARRWAARSSESFSSDSGSREDFLRLPEVISHPPHHRQLRLSAPCRGRRSARVRGLPYQPAGNPA